MRQSALLKDEPERPCVVVVGGGFSGLAACRRLRKKFNVVLVDAKEYFEYYPGILRAYLHPAEHGKLCAMYQQVCDGMDCRFVWAEVTSINPIERSVAVKCMAQESEQTVDYDYCIVTSGSQYGLYMSSGKYASAAAECLWYPTFLDRARKTQSKWGSLDERFLSGRRAHFEAELKVLKDLAKQKATIVIIGAGFVGIEWATEVKYYLPEIDVVVVESRAECVSVMPPRCRQYCQRYMDKVGIRTFYNVDYKSVTSAPSEADREQLDKLGVHKAARLYMAVGVRSINQFLPAECLDDMKYDPGTGDVTRGGFIVCNKSMQVLDKGAQPWGGGRVFAAGNCCNVQGMRLPKNSFPGEDMAKVCAYNIEVMSGAKSSKGGCFSFLRPKKLKEIHWTFGMGLCATSLGPFDATFVAGGTEKPGSGYTVLTGVLSAYQKEFIRWSKVDETRMGFIGHAVWCMVH
mmetsp:Transcript_11563/g.26359  ORF Transcript_11563/g.26359 Transcript_11563/m.26359 type:complete len:460 (+) Transcript_11563:80-1459(+)